MMVCVISEKKSITLYICKNKIKKSRKRTFVHYIFILETRAKVNFNLMQYNSESIPYFGSLSSKREEEEEEKLSIILLVPPPQQYV